MPLTFAAALALTAEPAPMSPARRSVEPRICDADRRTGPMRNDRRKRRKLLQRSGQSQLTIRCTRSTRRIGADQACRGRVAVDVGVDELAAEEPAGDLRPRDGTGKCRTWRHTMRCSTRSLQAADASASARPGSQRSSFRRGRSRTGDRGLPRLNPREAKKFAEYSHHYKSCAEPRKTHLHLGFNAAKGGDPMSHGSAGRSERGVRKL